MEENNLQYKVKVVQEICTALEDSSISEPVVAMWNTCCVKEINGEPYIVSFIQDHSWMLHCCNAIIERTSSTTKKISFDLEWSTMPNKEKVMAFVLIGSEQEFFIFDVRNGWNSCLTNLFKNGKLQKLGFALTQDYIMLGKLGIVESCRDCALEIEGIPGVECLSLKSAIRMLCPEFPVHPESPCIKRGSDWSYMTRDDYDYLVLDCIGTWELCSTIINMRNRGCPNMEEFDRVRELFINLDGPFDERLDKLLTYPILPNIGWKERHIKKAILREMLKDCPPPILTNPSDLENLKKIGARTSRAFCMTFPKFILWIANQCTGFSFSSSPPHIKAINAERLVSQPNISPFVVGPGQNRNARLVHLIDGPLLPPST